MVKCPTCGKENFSGNRFCGDCGTNLSIAKMYCIYCRREFSDGEKFCTYCGEKLFSWEDYCYITMGETPSLICSECGKKVKPIAVEIHNRCPHCGAKPFKYK